MDRGDFVKRPALAVSWALVKLLLSLLLCLYGAQGLAAGGFAEACLRFLGKAVDYFGDPEAKFQTDPSLTAQRRDLLWLEEPGFRNRLERATEGYLAQAAAAFAGTPLARAQEFTIEGDRYRVVQVLGDGSDTRPNGVFLCIGPDGRQVVVKKFKDETTLRNNNAEMEAYRGRRTPTLGELRVDASQNIVVLEYVRGIPVTEVLSPNRALLNRFDQADVAMFRRRYDEFRRRNPTLPREEGNIFFDVSSGRFVVIDPW